MSRPSGPEWRPFGLTEDPVQGDPALVAGSARQLADNSALFADLAAKLATLAAGGTETGLHADAIRTTASSLCGSLRLVAERFARVSSALSQWAPQLEQAQAMSLSAWADAGTPYALLNSHGAHLDPAVAASAQAQLDQARALLGKATAQRDAAAADCAALIRAASQDGLTDDWWYDFLSFVSEYAWAIRDVCEVLEIAAAVLAVIALVATGAGAALLVAGEVMTAVALAGRTLLAATGNGSWLDVGVDVVGLVTLGAGDRVLGSAGKVAGEADRLSGQAADAMHEIPHEPPLGARVADGGVEPARLDAKMRAIAARSPDNPRIQALNRDFSRKFSALRVITAGNLADTIGAILGGPSASGPGGTAQPYHVGPWDQAENGTTAALPGFRLAGSTLS